MNSWAVPPELAHRHRDDPDSARWVAVLPDLAAELAGAWGLAADGPARAGFNAAVWPVRRRGEPLVLKVTRPGVATGTEARALAHWAVRGATVGVHAHDPDRNALLLERLDAGRCLQEHPDIDEACTTIGRLLAALSPTADAPEPEGFTHVSAEAERMQANVERERERHPRLLPESSVRRAMETFEELREPSNHDRLLHFDAHFLNVLHTQPARTDAGEPGWRLIDPLPWVGPVELELVAMLRNRWEDAVVTGDPDRALRRRVDQVAELVGADPDRARAVAQAVAVDNLLWLLPRDPGHLFVAPYAVLAGWSA